MSAEEVSFGGRMLALGRHLSVPFSFELTGAATAVVPMQPDALVTLRGVAFAAGFEGDEPHVVELTHGHAAPARAVVARLVPGRVEAVRLEIPLSAHAERVALSLARGAGPVSVFGTIETRLDGDESGDDEGSGCDGCGDLAAYPAEPARKGAAEAREAIKRRLEENRRDVLAQEERRDERDERRGEKREEQKPRDGKAEKKRKDAGGPVFRDVRGVKVCDVVEGSGPGVKQGQRASVGYVLRLGDANGRVLDETRGKKFKFRVGVGEVISGWDIGVAGMRAGGKRLIVVPPHLGYGKKGVPPDIPPDATLHFEVVLHGFQ
ncbi:Peptidyl-prolyl cis-trans isomerase [Giardia muris]|uniref:peptidylprolyl isomerase n=1 Tax=Giardia muris TaxID=5742 RepID=A0A4Z1SVJ6_GIAMU|nr:Peptidyl-prolyl cis-trans isomerase [Giardia muris]|eukprot:TNJ27608.1 Peptidyl-prolyl cis-trans isomerase [Giardia muris]